MPSGYKNGIKMSPPSRKGKTPWNKGNVKIIKKECIFCGKEYLVNRKYSFSQIDKSKFCSRKCSIKRTGEINRGRFLQEKSPSWKGGKPKCVECNELITYGSNYCKIHKGHLTTGKKNGNWKGENSITPVNKRIRVSSEYKDWRDRVFRRDNYTCVWCGIKGGTEKNNTGEWITIQADHIKPFSLFPELRFDVDNGRTLCIPCHRKTFTYGKRVKKLNRNSKDYWSRGFEEGQRETERKSFWSYCAGCPEGHSSFHRTVILSPQWKLWKEEISRRINKHNKKKSRIYTGVWDIDECQECGWISKEHWADFVKFIKKRNDSGQK